MPELNPAVPIYDIPEHPIYNPIIRALKASDPANAETIFNPLFRQIIENIHAIKLKSDGKAAVPEINEISLSTTAWEKTGEQYQQTAVLQGIISNEEEESLVLIVPMKEVEMIGACQVTASNLQTDTIVFSAEDKPENTVTFLAVNMGIIKK